MDANLLALRWDNHNSTFFEVLSKIRQKELYTDVTLAAGGKYFSAHKLVLSTCSDFFEEIFEKTPCKHPVIVLKDIDAQNMESLLSYIYCGEVRLTKYLQRLIHA